MKKEKKKDSTFQSVRISGKVHEAVRKYCKEKKGLIGGFFEVAAMEKLKKETATTN